MKKIIPAVIIILTMSSTSAFGMYGDQDDWIDFLTDGNQLRARMDQLGFVLGNNTIKGTFGLRTQDAITSFGSIISGKADNLGLDATVSMGIGYTSDIFSVGLGYNFTYYNSTLGVHTPVLVVNALNNNLRIAIPIQISASKEPFGKDTISKYNDYLGISTDIQIRYYTAIDLFNQVRLYIKYGQSGYKNVQNNFDMFAQSFGFETRLYFLNTQIVNVNINPFIKVSYNTALASSDVMIRAGESLINTIYSKKDNKWEKNPYNVTAAAVLGLTANSDIVSLYVEPSLGYNAVYEGKFKTDSEDYKVQHNLYWGAYTELYITPVKDLEWYFEMDVNNGVPKLQGNPIASGNNIPVVFGANTGITWYLPALQ
ncbi:variable surface family protein [Brachyspira hyodysenteriae]|uniref:cell surface protein n=1 Tax=Brachyspira hyodysenteriae TaxID=159 RepID=UPI0022CDB4CB|nr:cell surface protein [Brachyspira hyodysenteriae]MCZ9839042.1 variable surface family protein [Brachyspira hyodysenteriae]MCZ9847661.1 variable surface family protein [Brachyspira hyodysenteriae]MCZ9870959.1 variable surface family protein [Brachyspira hyodysenteriae]MCZ9872388.1 variable surface family protein [Brachyspira hyodysenteriae]MCZ9877949.1 variable surface family protein [Brachyspira hyodysenteriae]